MEGSGLLGGYQYPPGFRFHPTDQELIIHYLSKKVNGTLSPATSIITDVDLYKFSPWDLPRNFFFGEGEWFFFSPRDRKYPNGARPNRAAGSGYWKATGTDKPILTSGGIQCLGVKKALVFYKGRPPKGIKTDWVMQEYRLLDGSTSSSQKHKGTMRLDDWVLCRVRQKGCVAMEEEKKTERSKLSHGVTLQQAEKNVLREREAMQPWTDHQLLAYLMNSAGSEEESECEIPQPGSAKSSNAAGAGGVEMSPFGEQQHEVSAMINSIKRNLSFGALDEVIMRLPSIKRLNYSSSVDEQMSSSGSFSADESYLS